MPPNSINTEAQVNSLADYSGNKLLLVIAILLPIQFICVSLRLFVRYHTKISFGLDDLVVVITMLGQIIWAAVVISAVKHSGMGYHTSYLEITNPALVISANKYRTAESFLYVLDAKLPKISILILYRRIFSTSILRILSDILIVALTTDILSCTILLFFMCRPFAANWDPSIPGAKCLDVVAIYTWGSLPNIITDIIMLLLPMPVIWSLHIGLRTKIQLTITFALGSLGLFVSVMRFRSFFLNPSEDFTWIGSNHGIWGQAEPATYLVCACIITFKPLFDGTCFKWGRSSTTVTAQSKPCGNVPSQEGIGGGVESTSSSYDGGLLFTSYA
ncbi:hypothetical protein N7528_009030 [Penicillium herquei]|nr:hypothetical protein N7528_009030 [Penicillium herquei]